jgi:polysaccharide export outer membrane protein
MRVSRVTLAALCALALSVGNLHAQEGYEIGPGDTVHVLVLGQDDMSGDMPVDQEGMLAFPILGKIKASTLTAKELERKLTILLADGYLRRPEVSVSVREYRSQRVYVTGEVQRPGVYALKSDRSLLALLGEVGNLTRSAGHEIIVTRPPRGLPPPVESPSEVDGETPTPPAPPGAETFRVNLADLRAGKQGANLLLEQGDTIHVPRASQVYISGHVGRPGAYRYEEGMTLRQALVLAGGVTERGSHGRTRVIRLVDGEKKKIKVKSDEPVQPEDTIVVPERFF